MEKKIVGYKKEMLRGVESLEFLGESNGDT